MTSRLVQFSCIILLSVFWSKQSRIAGFLPVWLFKLNHCSLYKLTSAPTSMELEYMSFIVIQTCKQVCTLPRSNCLCLFTPAQCQHERQPCQKTKLTWLIMQANIETFTSLLFSSSSDDVVVCIRNSASFLNLFRSVARSLSLSIAWLSSSSVKANHC